MSTSYQIQGRTITLPVEVRRATMWAAVYRVDAARAQELVPKQLEVATMGRHAVLTLAFVRYEDGDLDAYNELAVSIGVRAHDALPTGKAQRTKDVLSGNLRVYIRHLPVNQTFTLEAGRTIWGYPKWLAEIEIEDQGSRTKCILKQNGSQILSLSIRNDGPLRIPQRPVPTYSDAEGGLMLTSWETRGNARGRFGGAAVVLGQGEIADELRSLGLPKRALFTNTVRNVHATFGEPLVV